MYTYQPIGIMFRMFIKRPGFNPRLIHAKDSKMITYDSLPDTQQYGSWVSGTI